MSWIRIWIHLVFSTKNREAFFVSKEKRGKVIEHIKIKSKTKRYLD